MKRSLLIFLFFWTSCFSQEIGKDEYSILTVVDGDTIRISDGSERGILVRLIGINAPESRDFKHRKKEPYGEEASAYLKRIIGDEPVKLEYDIEKYDKYNRLLAYCYSSTGVFLNEAMVKAGWAEIMTIQPNTKYADLFYQAQKDARDNKRGIWQTTD